MNFSMIQRAMRLLSGITGIMMPLWHLLGYLLTALALYTIAKRRGILHPWLAWIPVADLWLLGSLSDQYRYVVRGEIRSRRKLLLALKIASILLTLIIIGIVTALAVSVYSGVMAHAGEAALIRAVMAPGLGIAGLTLPLLGISIALMIIRYMALFDVFTSCDPQNSALFLILSILIGFTQPLFLFICRDKDYGMPPRRDQRPADVPPESDAEEL